MIYQTVGNKENPAILFFHAMGVTGESNMPVAEYLKDKYYCIMPTSTVDCQGQKYISKAEELWQLERYLAQQQITELVLVVASSLGQTWPLHFLQKRNCRFVMCSLTVGSLRRSARQPATLWCRFCIWPSRACIAQRAGR